MQLKNFMFFRCKSSNTVQEASHNQTSWKVHNDENVTRHMLHKLLTVVDVFFMVFRWWGRSPITSMDRKHTVSTCFNNVKYFSICEPGI